MNEFNARRDLEIWAKKNDDNIPRILDVAINDIIEILDHNGVVIDQLASSVLVEYNAGGNRLRARVPLGTKLPKESTPVITEYALCNGHIRIYLNNFQKNEFAGVECVIINTGEEFDTMENIENIINNLYNPHLP